jgi:hypothetical protein
MKTSKPLWWTYRPSIPDDLTRRDVTIYIGPPSIPPRLVHLKNVNRQEIAAAGQLLFELEQIRYESEGVNDGNET